MKILKRVAFIFVAMAMAITLSSCTKEEETTTITKEIVIHYSLTNGDSVADEINETLEEHPEYRIKLINSYSTGQSIAYTHCIVVFEYEVEVE